jgi:predicted nuclease of predicted toxin-antitoxin system
MRFLLDENLPAKLRFNFGAAHMVRTVRELGWNGLKDKPLLELMQSHYYDALVTMDKSLRYQQDLSRYPVVIFLLVAANSKHQTLQPLVEKLQTLQWPTGRGQVIEVKA